MAATAASGRAARGAIGEAHRLALDTLERKLANSAIGVREEYEKLNCQSSEEQPCSVGNRPLNAPSNRYFNVLPYDFNRVVLEEGSVVPLPRDGYINASQLSSRSGEAPAWTYIATQAPMPETISHFWAMVWAQKSAVILMLTKDMEAGVRKGHSYFPATGREARHGNLAVRVKEERQVGSDVIHRRMVVIHASGSRDIDHYLYHAWPDHGVPTSTRPLRQLASLLDTTNTHAEGPAIVHCSAGIGRSGTFCAVDVGLRRLRALHPSDTASATQAIKVRTIVSHLRKQRSGMVQTPEQFLFIFRALREELQEGALGVIAAGGTGAAVAPRPAIPRRPSLSAMHNSAETTGEHANRIATGGVDSSQAAVVGEDPISQGRVSRSKQHALNFSAQLADAKAAAGGGQPLSGSVGQAPHDLGSTKQSNLTSLPHEEPGRARQRLSAGTLAAAESAQTRKSVISLLGTSPPPRQSFGLAVLGSIDGQTHLSQQTTAALQVRQQAVQESEAELERRRSVSCSASQQEAEQQRTTSRRTFFESPTTRSNGGSILGSPNSGGGQQKSIKHPSLASTDRSSSSGGWAGLLGGASTAADPWLYLTRQSSDDAV